MHEIKFRGKAIKEVETNADHVEKNDWVTGYYYFHRGHMCGIIVTQLEAVNVGVGSGLLEIHILVDHETVGQYTGRKDKNGKEIYSGDICKAKNRIRAIEFDTGSFCFEKTILYYIFELEVIGNIHDNPELLEVK